MSDITLTLSKKDVGLLLAALDWYELSASKEQITLDKPHCDDLSARLMRPFFEPAELGAPPALCPRCEARMARRTMGWICEKCGQRVDDR